MHNHQHQHSEGVLIAVLLVALIMGALLIGGGYVFWTRASMARVQAVQSEMMARTEAEHARQLAMELEAIVDPPHAVDATLIAIKLEADGSLLVDGSPTQIDGLREVLANKSLDNDSLSFSIRADDQCTVADLKLVMQICESFGNVEIDLDPAEDSDPTDD